MTGWAWFYLIVGLTGGLLLAAGEIVALRERRGHTITAFVRRLPWVGRGALIAGLVALAAHFAGWF